MERKSINSNKNDFLLEIGKELHQIIDDFQTNMMSHRHKEIEPNKENESNIQINLGRKRKNSINLDEIKDEDINRINPDENKVKRENEKIAAKNKKLKK